MSSRYSSASSSTYSYHPLSPPWSQGGSPPPAQPFDSPPRAPVMRYAALPPVDGYVPPAHTLPRNGLMTPPPSPGELHPALAARSTVVRYDLAADPRTVRMSSSAPVQIFPSLETASRPSLPFLTIECETSGQTVTVYASDPRVGVTCFDVIAQLHQYFAQSMHSDEWRRIRDVEQRRAMKNAYAHRTGRAYDSHATMKMIDYLAGHTIFKRLAPKRNDASGSLWVLQTTC
ncbi:hypothetical protein K439DRAFT_437013 [Ramaria rubella]|nr:hypothetical protein K439DRAFT_437013 [Ramaria rubella]